MEELFPYTPRKTKFEVLKATLVGRRVLLEELKATIRDQARAETLQHWMILGTRGTGKSHIITLLYHIVKNEADYNTTWVPVLMNEEEQGVFSLHTFFIRVITKLADELESDNRVKTIEIRNYLSGMRDKKTSPEALLEDATTFLKTFTEGSRKRLIVFLENADDLFTKCMPNQNEVKKFRRMLQHETHFLLIATSPTFFERIRSTKGVLYDLFRIRRLDLLTYDESIILLQKWAESEKPSLTDDFKRGNYRLRVLYHLTGGNPRILMFLFMAISGQRELGSAVSTFRTLLEQDLSNYYLSRMRDIPNQEQPVVIALAESAQNLTQTQIARRTFLPQRSVGTFVVRLENAGLVRSVSRKRGRNTLYTLTDHLFRLWYQWRTSLRERETIEAIVEFLSIWYKRIELETWTAGDGVFSKYAQEAMDFRDTQRFKGYIDLFRLEGKQAVDSYLSSKDYIATVETIDFLKEYGIDTSEVEVSIADAVNRCETLQDLECFSKALKGSTIKSPRTFIEIGKAFLNKEDYSDAEEVLLNAVALNPNDPAAWLILGIGRAIQKNYAGAEEAFLRAATLDPNDAGAWRILGMVRSDQNNFSGAEEALLKAVALDPNSAAAWRYLGQARTDQENHVGAEQAFSKAAALDPNEVVTWRNLASANFKNYHFQNCINSILKSFELKGELGKVIAMLSKVYLRTDKFPELLEMMENTVQDKSSPVEVRTQVLFYRAMLLLHKGDLSLSKKDLSTALEFLSSLADELKRDVQGRLIDFVLDVTYGDNISEIKLYMNSLKACAPELASVLSPLDYFIQYFEAYYSEEKDPQKGIKRAQELLERIPSELRDAVEAMVKRVKENINWWKNRPQDSL